MPLSKPRQARIFGVFALLTAALFCASCSSHDGGEKTLPGQCKTALSSPVLPSAKLTIAGDGRLLDALGRDVIMRGVNAGGRSKWAPFFPFPFDAKADDAAFRAKADAFFGRLKAWGLDSVRLTFSWEALEPDKGKYDEQYLDRFAAMVDACGDLDLRVVIDFHQDVYALPFCGDGFPLWTLKPIDRKQTCKNGKSWFANYTNPDVVASYARFFTNKDGILDSFKAMWTKMATRFAKHDAVVGFEIINEPGGWEFATLKTWKEQTLNPFHTDMVAVINKAAPGKLVFFDNPGVDAVGITSVTHVRPKGEGVVYAPHYYDSNLLLGGKAGNSDPAADLQPFAAFSTSTSMHTLLGEFGYGHGATGGEGWLGKVMTFVDDARWSATLWEYSINETLWNHEDLSVVDADAKERPVLDVYVRPWLRAVAGSTPSFSWDPGAGHAEASWTADGGVSELVVPERLFGGQPKKIEVTDGCWTWDKARSALLIKGSDGAPVKVSFGL